MSRNLLLVLCSDKYFKGQPKEYLKFNAGKCSTRKCIGIVGIGMLNNLNLNIQEAQQIPSRISTRKMTPRQSHSTAKNQR